jgi:hypothetical protein
MSSDDKKPLKNILDSPAWKKIQEEIRQAEVQYKNECDAFWNELSYEDKLKAFYSVCNRIFKGDVEDRGTYRYVLYDVFGFGPDAYGIGMECGYMTIHNCIFEGIEKQDKEVNDILNKETD